MISICTACGTSYASPGDHPEVCEICEDARQFVPRTGQTWTTLPALLASHSNKWQQHDAGLLSLTTVPGFAIGQRAFILRTAEGNILWDCLATLDDATKTMVNALAGLKAIALSHPHFYTTMQDWAAEFNAPIYLPDSDRQWIMRDSPHIRLWEGETLNLTSDVTVIRLGGHFAGSSVLHWARDGGILLTGDTLQVTPGTNAVSFMWSYPNMLPLPAATVSDMTHRLSGVTFARLYGGFEGKDIADNADSIVQHSSEIYINCLR